MLVLEVCKCEELCIMSHFFFIAFLWPFTADDSPRHIIYFAVRGCDASNKKNNDNLSHRFLRSSN